MIPLNEPKTKGGVSLFNQSAPLAKIPGKFNGQKMCIHSKGDLQSNLTYQANLTVAIEPPTG